MPAQPPSQSQNIADFNFDFDAIIEPPIYTQTQYNKAWQTGYAEGVKSQNKEIQSLIAQNIKLQTQINTNPSNHIQMDSNKQKQNDAIDALMNNSANSLPPTVAHQHKQQQILSDNQNKANKKNKQSNDDQSTSTNIDKASLKHPNIQKETMKV